MKCDLCNKMITVVCDFSAVKVLNSMTKSVSTLRLCVHACVHIAC